MQSWLERARAAAPKRAIKRGSSDLPTLEDLEEHGDYLRGLLAEDPSMGWHKLREAINAKGFLVSERTMRNWLDRYHGKCSRALLVAPSEGLPCLDLKGLRLYEAELLEKWSANVEITYTQLKEFLEQTYGCTCSKNAMMHWMQSPFQTFPMVSIEELRGDYGRPVRSTCLGGDFGSPRRLTCIWSPCPDPDYEIALVSENTYASNTEMCAAFVEGDKSIKAVIQKVRKEGMNEDLSLEDLVEARSYAERVGFC
jgi:hypothetical protein